LFNIVSVLGSIFIIAPLVGLFNHFKNTLSNLWTVLKYVGAFLYDTFAPEIEYIGGIFEWMGGIFGAVGEAANSFGEAVQGLLKKFGLAELEKGDKRTWAGWAAGQDKAPTAEGVANGGERTWFQWAMGEEKTQKTHKQRGELPEEEKSFYQHGTKKGSIYTHDIHLEKLLDQLIPKSGATVGMGAVGAMGMAAMNPLGAIGESLMAPANLVASAFGFPEMFGDGGATKTAEPKSLIDVGDKLQADYASEEPSAGSAANANLLVQLLSQQVAQTELLREGNTYLRTIALANSDSGSVGGGTLDGGSTDTKSRPSMSKLNANWPSVYHQSSATQVVNSGGNDGQ